MIESISSFKWICDSWIIVLQSSWSFAENIDSFLITFNIIPDCWLKKRNVCDYQEENWFCVVSLKEENWYSLDELLKVLSNQQQSGLKESFLDKFWLIQNSLGSHLQFCNNWFSKLISRSHWNFLFSWCLI